MKIECACIMTVHDRDDRENLHAHAHSCHGIFCIPHFLAFISAWNLTTYVHTLIRPKVFRPIPSACGSGIFLGPICPYGELDMKFIEKYTHNSEKLWISIKYGH